MRLKSRDLSTEYRNISVEVEVMQSTTLLLAQHRFIFDMIYTLSCFDY
jgi:hypothetical protein